MAEPATAAYFSRIDDATVSRHFSARLDIYFNGSDAPPISLAGGALADYSFKREMAAEDTFPLGRVSRSSLTINLNNVLQHFTFTNTASPYYGKLKQGTKVILYTGLQMANGTFEEFQMGVLYTSDWDVASSTVVANLVCYDRLHFLRQQKAPKMPVFYNTTIAQLFERLFLSLGLLAGDFIIDSALNYTIPYGWLPGETVEDVLRELTLAGMCVVYTDRYDRIVVTVPYVRKDFGRVLSASATGNAQIKAVSQLQASYKSYTGVNIRYNIYTRVDETLLATLSTQHLDPYMNEFMDIYFSAAPALQVDKIIAYEMPLDIAAMNVGANTADLFVNSAEELEDVDIQIYGKTLSSTSQLISFNVPNEGAEKKRLDIHSVLMQTKEAAKEYGAVLNQIVTDPGAYLNASLRGDLTFDLGDVYVLDAPRSKIDQLPVYFTRITLNYNGALSCEVDCTKYDALAVYDYAYIMPGLFVRVLRT